MITENADDGDRIVLVYATFPDFATADLIARSVVEDHLAACANLLPSMTSVYWWQGRCETASEVVGIFKTRAACAADVMTAIADRHPYETPAILVVEVADVAPAFGRWIVDETSAAPDADG